MVGTAQLEGAAQRDIERRAGAATDDQRAHVTTKLDCGARGAAAVAIVAMEPALKTEVHSGVEAQAQLAERGGLVLRDRDVAAKHVLVDRDGNRAFELAGHLGRGGTRAHDGDQRRERGE